MFLLLPYSYNYLIYKPLVNMSLTPDLYMFGKNPVL